MTEIVITGKSSRFSRSEFNRRCNDLGIQVADKVTATTRVVFAHPASVSRGTSKAKRAKALSIPILDLSVLESILSNYYSLVRANGLGALHGLSAAAPYLAPGAVPQPASFNASSAAEVPITQRFRSAARSPSAF